MKEKIISILRELFYTFSSKKSFLSSKRIERFFAFSLACAIIVTYFIIKAFCLFHCAMTATDAVMLSATLFGYGSWTMHKTEQAKNKQNEEVN